METVAHPFYNTPAFDEFARHLSAKPFSEVIMQFARNAICQILDPTVTELLASSQNNLIFSNNALTRQEQSKIFLGKLVGQLCDKDLTYFDAEKKEGMIKYFIEQLNHIQDLDKITNGKDLYTLLVNRYAQMVTYMLYVGSTSVFGQITENNTSKQLSKYIESLNSIYTNNPKTLNMKLLSNDADDTDTTVDLNSESDSESDSDDSDTTVELNDKSDSDYVDTLIDLNSESEIDDSDTVEDPNMDNDFNPNDLIIFLPSTSNDNKRKASSDDISSNKKQKIE